MQPNNTSREVYLALRERVLAAKGADRRLWCEIVVVLLDDGPAIDEMELRLGRVMFAHPGLVNAAAKDDCTIGIDPALALFDRVLPGLSREVGRSGFGTPAWCRWWNPMLSPGANEEGRSDHSGGSEPLAVLAALLTALAGGRTHG